MLNRTNRTLSANLNRLNLGTRSLAVYAGANNNGELTLRFIHAHPLVVVDVRVGVAESPRPIRFGFPSIEKMGPKSMKPAMLPMSGSSPESSQLRQSCGARDQQGQLISLAIPPATPVVVPQDGSRAQRGDAPRALAPRRLSRTSLAWRRDRSRPAGRAARVALVPVATP